MTAVLVGDSLVKYLGRHTEKEGIVTRSLSGAKVADVPDFPWDIERFKFVIVHVGINDPAYIPRTPRQVLDDFTKLLGSLRERNPRAVVFLSGVTPRDRNRWHHDEGISNHNALNKKVYALNEGIKHLSDADRLT